MLHSLFNPIRIRRSLAAILVVALGVVAPHSANADKKKKADTTPAPVAGPRKFSFDPKTLVWPSPPSVARVRWLDYFAGSKIDYTAAANDKPKATWMDRLAGGQSDTEKVNLKTFPFQLIGPAGIGLVSVCTREQKNLATPSRQEIERKLVNERVELLSRQLMRDLHRQANLDLRDKGV